MDRSVKNIFHYLQLRPEMADRTHESQLWLKKNQPIEKVKLKRHTYGTRRNIGVGTELSNQKGRL